MSSVQTSQLTQKIYLDTTVLDQGWPTLSIRVENIVTLSRKLGIKVVLPTPVLMELHAHWLDATPKRIDLIKRSIRELGCFLPELKSPATVPDLDHLEGRYRNLSPS